MTKHGLMLIAGNAALIATCNVAHSANESLENSAATRPGWEIGVQLSDYRYEEPGLGVKIWGPRVGLTAAYTQTHTDNWFFKFDGRAGYGSLEYEGSGTMDSVPDWVFEVRGYFGKDFFPSPSISLSPYAGLGYRYLYNDLRGNSSTGAVGYRRYSQYIYVPLGLTSRIGFSGGWSVSPTVEYDYFVTGTQDSRLTDTNLGLLDAENEQSDGYGYRLSVMVEKESWAFGPWIQFWNIDDSDIVPVGFGLGAQEPQNETREYGIEVKYRF